MNDTDACWYQFGPYRLHPARRELLRGDHPIALPPKAFDILLLLLRNRDRVVSKDELLNAIWPAVIVEEANLSQNIFLVRKALGEDEAGRHYIATVSRRGYRFAASVRISPDSEAQTDQEPSPLAADEGFDGPAAPAATAAVPASPFRRTRAFVWPVGTGAAIAIALILILGFAYWRGGSLHGTSETIVLADFANATGDPIFDGTLRQGLAAQLDQSPVLTVLSEQRVAQILALMSKSENTGLTEAVAKEVCLRAGGSTVVDGAIAQLGTEYVLTVKAVDCAGGEARAALQERASDKTHVLDALGRVATSIRQRLGEPTASVHQYDAPPEDVTTPSLQALQLYSLGYASMIRQHDYVTAIPLFERAITLDPNFAMAYARLAICLYDQDQPERAAEGFEKAYALSGRVSERERLYIAASREAMATGNMESARQSYEVWSRIYPNDQFAFGNLGVVYGFLGQYQRALIALERAWDLNRANAVVYSNVVTTDMQLGNLAGAKSKALKAKELNVDSSAVHLTLYFIDFLQHDPTGMSREVSQLSAEPGWGDRVLYREAQTAAYGGQFARARDLIRLAAEAAEQDGKQEVAAAYEAEGAVREALVANFVLARREATDALSRSSGKEVTALAALALALAGEPATANRLTSDLAEHFPEDTAVQWTCLPVIRAANALAAGSPTGAVEELAHARYEMGETFQIVNFKLYPPYLRGLAYLTLRQGAAAAVEFRKVTDHPGLTLDETIAPLAHLGLARARAMVGDEKEARDQYAEFLSLWSQADGDLGPLAQARLEYAKLR